MTPPDAAASRVEADRLRNSLLARFQSARSPAIRGPALWEAIDALMAAGRHSWALTVLEERGEDLDPIRVTFRRVDALLAQGGQGRQRAALDVLRQAQASGVVDLASTIDHLLRSGALSLAAQILQLAPPSSLAASLRAEVSSAARLTCRGGSLQTAPFAFADAVRALQILSPQDAAMAGHVRRAAAVLTAQLGEASRQEDFTHATELLIRLARLVPDDLEVLQRLADTAGKAGRRARELDTLMRIHALRRDRESLRRAFQAALAQSRWTILGQILRATTDGEPGTPDDLEFPEDIRNLALETVDRLIATDEVDGASRLGAAIKDRLAAEDWPVGLLERLLSASRRQLRGALVDPIASSRLLRLHLTLFPEDIAAARMLARLRMRLRRSSETRRILEDLVRLDPHVAEDWRDLALLRREAGDVAGADECILRAWLIQPAPSEAAAYRDAVLRLAAA